MVARAMPARRAGRGKGAGGSGLEYETPARVEVRMNEDRNQDRFPKQQARQKHPDEWQRELNPDHLAGQNIGRESDERLEPDRRNSRRAAT